MHLAGDEKAKLAARGFVRDEPSGAQLLRDMVARNIIRLDHARSAAHRQAFGLVSCPRRPFG
jgi:hypothetical protein